MRAMVVASATAVVAGLLTACSSTTPASDLVVGDCVQMGGPPDRPETVEAACASPESNYRVVAVYSGTDSAQRCPSDVDSYYSMRGSFSDSRTTVCLDIDWVVGDCMSIDPDGDADPVRVDCADAQAPGRQRATEILADVANVDQCASGVGYSYDERDFTVCVEDVP